MHIHYTYMYTVFIFFRDMELILHVESKKCINGSIKYS